MLLLLCRNLAGLAHLCKICRIIHIELIFRRLVSSVINTAQPFKNRVYMVRFADIQMLREIEQNIGILLAGHLHIHKSEIQKHFHNRGKLFFPLYGMHKRF